MGYISFSWIEFSPRPAHQWRHPVLTGAFTYMRFARSHEVSLPDVAAFEHLAGTSYTESEDETNKYYVAFQALEESADEPDVSRDKIARAAREISD